MKTSAGDLKIGYDEVYLDSSQDILGHCFDWVANTCDDDLAVFAERFADSPVGKLFEQGCPKYIAGVNGAELANAVMESLELPAYGQEPEFWADKSPEYWVGWILAYYQWYRKETFHAILARIPINKFLRLYHLGHEMSEENVVSILDGINPTT